MVQIYAKNLPKRCTQQEEHVDHFEDLHENIYVYWFNYVYTSYKHGHLNIHTSLLQYRPFFSNLFWIYDICIFLCSFYMNDPSHPQIGIIQVESRCTCLWVINCLGHSCWLKILILLAASSSCWSWLVPQTGQQEQWPSERNSQFIPFGSYLSYGGVPSFLLWITSGLIWGVYTWNTNLGLVETFLDYSTHWTQYLRLNLLKLLINWDYTIWITIEPISNPSERHSAGWDAWDTRPVTGPKGNEPQLCSSCQEGGQRQGLQMSAGRLTPPAERCLEFVFSWSCFAIFKDLELMMW